MWLVVDDYELVHAAARPGLVSELANLVPYAARLGLSVLLAQGANGSGARVDPLIRRLLEGSPWHLQFSVESKHELLLRGTRGTPLPPGQALLARPGRPDSLLAVLPPRPPLTAPGTPPPAARDAGLAEPHTTEEVATDVEAGRQTRRQARAHPAGVMSVLVTVDRRFRRARPGPRRRRPDP